MSVSSEGDPETVAIGATQLSASVDSGVVWAMFPEDRRLAAYDVTGGRTKVIEVDGSPHAIAAADGTDRVYAAVGDEVIGYDSESQGVATRIAGAAELLGTVPETTAVWAVNGTSARVFEPHSGSQIGSVSFERPPSKLIGEPLHHRLLAVSDGRLECASGRPQFAWRSRKRDRRVAAMVLFAFLFAMRLTGNLWVAGLAALFLAIDGLAFTISRIAMNDSYSTAFMLGAWFCAMSALRAWGRNDRSESTTALAPRDRIATVGWLFATGVLRRAGHRVEVVGALRDAPASGSSCCGTASAASDRSIWRVAGPFVPSAVVVLGTLVVLPIAIYVLTYIAVLRSRSLDRRLLPAAGAACSAITPT